MASLVIPAKPPAAPRRALQLSRWTGLFLGPGACARAGRRLLLERLGLSRLPQQVETHLLAFPRPPQSGEWVSGPWSQSPGPAEVRRGGAQPGVHMESRPLPCAPAPKASRTGSWVALPGRLGVQTGRGPGGLGFCRRENQPS